MKVIRIITLIIAISYAAFFAAIGIIPLSIIILFVWYGLTTALPKHIRRKKQEKQDNAYASFNNAALEAEQMAWNMQKQEKTN